LIRYSKALQKHQNDVITMLFENYYYSITNKKKIVACKHWHLLVCNIISLAGS